MLFPAPYGAAVCASNQGQSVSTRIMMIVSSLTVTRNPIVSLPLLITFVAAKWLRGGALTDERLVGSADI